MTERGFWHGRSGLVVPVLLAAWTTYLLLGVLTMEVPEGTDFPGPRFVPNILIVAGYVLSALLVLCTTTGLLALVAPAARVPVVPV